MIGGDSVVELASEPRDSGEETERVGGRIRRWLRIRRPGPGCYWFVLTLIMFAKLSEFRVPAVGTDAYAVARLRAMVVIIVFGYGLTWCGAGLLHRHLRKKRSPIALTFEGPRWRPVYSRHWVRISLSVAALELVVAVLLSLARNAPAPVTYNTIPTGASATFVAATALSWLLAGLFEEPVHRGAIQGFVNKRFPAIVAGPAAALIATAVFVGFHIGGPLGYDRYAAASVFISGLLCSWLTYRHEGLWPAVVTHTVFNGTVFLLSVLPDGAFVLAIPLAVPAVLALTRDTTRNLRSQPVSLEHEAPT